MIKFGDYRSGNIGDVSYVCAGLFANPYKHDLMLNRDLNIIRFGIDADLQYVNEKELYDIVGAPRINFMDTSKVAAEIEDKLPPVILFSIDEYPTVMNVESAFQGLRHGARQVPIIVVREANPDAVRHILTIPSGIEVCYGFVYDANKTGGIPLTSLRDCLSVKEAQDTLTKASQIRAHSGLNESTNSLRIIREFQGVSNQSFPIGKTTANDSTNSYQLFLDRDNLISLKMVPMLADDNEDRWTMFVDGTFNMLHTKLTIFNYGEIADLVGKFVDLRSANVACTHVREKFDTHNQITDAWLWSASKLDPQFDQYVIKCFTDRLQLSVSNIIMERVKDIMLICKIDCGPIHYRFTIRLDTNEIDLEVNLENYCIGNMVVTDDNTQKLINGYRELIKLVNENPSIQCVLAMHHYLKLV